MVSGLLLNTASDFGQANEGDEERGFRVMLALATNPEGLFGRGVISGRKGYSYSCEASQLRKVGQLVIT